MKTESIAACDIFMVGCLSDLEKGNAFIMPYFRTRIPARGSADLEGEPPNVIEVPQATCGCAYFGRLVKQAGVHATF